MHLVAAKCTQCGADLEVNPAQDAAICNHCNTPFITDKAIKNYNTYNTTYNHTHQNITGETVNVYNANPDFEIRAGELIKYNGSATEVIIPDNVKVIGKRAFYDLKYITNIIIPNGLKSIGEDSFAGCESLERITIPNSIISIGDGAFYNCTGLMNITIPNSVTSIEKGVFSQCEGLTNITIPNSVMSIGDYAFCWCINLTSITISNSVTHIGKAAFTHCTGLKSISVSDNITTIVEDAFVECVNLKDIKISSLNWEKFKKVFEDTPYYKIKEEEYEAQRKREQDEQRRAWQAAGKCWKCGGSLSIFKKCKSCGEKNL
jgi:hypothetical protein